MNVKQKLTSARTVVAANKTRILVATTVVTTTVAVIQQRAIQQHNKFLKEEGLYDKYYETDET